MTIRLITPKRFADPRGWFSETFSVRGWQAVGVDTTFVQDNHSLSLPAFTLRGLHFQAPPHAQEKLVRCIRGRIFDVAVDLRAGSPTYGRWEGFELDAESGRQAHIPIGYAHGFLTLAPDTEVIYKVSDYYAAQSEGGIAWNDRDIGVDWPLPANLLPVLSGKDMCLSTLASFQSPFAYDGTPFMLQEISI